jgi:transposase-like protein
MKQPQTLQEAIQYFSDEQVCVDAVAAMRWPDGKPKCPACEKTDHYYLKSQRRWKCKECGRQFSVKLNTIFEDSPIGLDKWLVAIWMIANCKNGVSSYEIHRAIGVTQKSAWFMLHRIRLALQETNSGKIGGGFQGTRSAVEADETFIGGKVKNMHASRRLKLEQMKSNGLKNETKTIVVGILDRAKGKVRAEVVANRQQDTLDAVIRQHVKLGTNIYTDDHVGYDNLRSRFNHTKLNKKLEGYVRGKVHTQGIENFWALLKRGLAGTYVSVEPAHLFRYVDEQVFRYNNRKNGKEKLKDADRFAIALSQISNKRLTYAEATGKTGER